MGLQVHNEQRSQVDDEKRPSVGIGMDASVMPIPGMSDISLAQTTDFFYPLVDDPYLQGRIACANVLSDLYAMGVVNCHNMLMLLALSKEMSDKERDIIIPLLMKGFQDTALEAGCKVTGGQTVVNPWCIIGGVASTVCKEGDVIMPEGATAGDVIVLTKALGTQVAVNAHQWLEEGGASWSRISDVTTKAEVKQVYRDAMLSMARLNRIGAILMHKYKAGACTDVTGFGILGHAENLSRNQLEPVDFQITHLPIIENIAKMEKHLGGMFRLLQGFSAETSGGLFMTISEDGAKGLLDEIQRVDGCEAWIIGTVVKGTRTAKIIDNPTVIEVKSGV